MNRLYKFVLVCLIIIAGWQSSSAQWPGVFNPVLQSGYQLQKSLTFVAASSQSLNRTFGTPTSNQIYTLALWIKRTTAGTAQTIFTGTASTNEIIWGDNSVYGGSTLNSFQLFGTNMIGSTAAADTTNWHHWVFAVDTTQVTAANRVHIYQDAVEVTYCCTGYPAQNATIGLNIASTLHQIGCNINNACAGQWLNAKIAAVYFVDGQQLTPSSFTVGSGSTTTHPVRYSGTLGNNGFNLSFCGAATGGDDGTGAQCSNAGSNTWTAVNAPATSTDVPN